MLPTKPRISVANGAITTTSLAVAEHFGRRHDDVLKAIRNAIAEVPEHFGARNFAGTSYRDVQGKERPLFRLSRDGFVYIAMGFTGKDAALWKVRYIEAFNQMEQALRRLPMAPSPVPLLPEPDDGLSGPLFTEMLRLVKVSGQATLLAYLIREGAHVAPLRRSTRAIETDLAKWICRMTVTKAARRLEARGLLTVTREAISIYHLNARGLLTGMQTLKLDTTVLPPDFHRLIT
ncbi:Rha family transcriptional regulator [Cupriavidus sp. YAF13]|uniref:Rha family transcriptional regulator n=1 Tax=Cupriavidus sp. YAF13 TaxID=3233075 RepID=UPI003F90C7F7